MIDNIKSRKILRRIAIESFMVMDELECLNKEFSFPLMSTCGTFVEPDNLCRCNMCYENK